MQEQPIEAIPAFPTNIYTVEKPEFIKQVRTAALDGLSGSKKAHDLYPVRMSSPMEMDPRLQDFARFTAITAGDILTDEGYNTSGMGAYFESMWCQEHHLGSGMDQHTHPGSLMIGFYFIDVPDNSSAITFFDPRPGKVASSFGEANVANVTMASNAFHMAPRSGLLVFAPSWLPHAFTRHGNTVPLRFVHFNIGLTEHRESGVEIV